MNIKHLIEAMEINGEAVLNGKPDEEILEIIELPLGEVMSQRVIQFIRACEKNQFEAAYYDTDDEGTIMYISDSVIEGKIKFHTKPNITGDKITMEFSFNQSEHYGTGEIITTLEALDKVLDECN